MCEAVADLATQSFIGISNGIYNDVGRELREGLISVAKRCALATDVDVALRELRSLVDLDRLALLPVWLELRDGVYRLKGFSIIREVETGDILTIWCLPRELW